MSWQGAPLFLSLALVGEDVAFEEVDNDLWTIRLATVAIGRYDGRRCRIHPLAALTEGRSASSAGSAPDLEDQNQ